MDYLIQAFDGKHGHMGTDGQALVKDAKSFKKVENRLAWFRPTKKFDCIKIFSYTNLYDEKTYKLVKTILKKDHKPSNELIKESRILSFDKFLNKGTNV